MVCDDEECEPEQLDEAVHVTRAGSGACMQRAWSGLDLVGLEDCKRQLPGYHDVDRAELEWPALRPALDALQRWLHRGVVVHSGGHVPSRGWYDQ